MPKFSLRHNRLLILSILTIRKVLTTWCCIWIKEDEGLILKQQTSVILTMSNKSFNKSSKVIKFNLSARKSKNMSKNNWILTERSGHNQKRLTFTGEFLRIVNVSCSLKNYYILFKFNEISNSKEKKKVKMNSRNEKVRTRNCYWCLSRLITKLINILRKWSKE